MDGVLNEQAFQNAAIYGLSYLTVPKDDSNAIQNAIVDAKGDLIAASANDTPARLAVGNNGETLVADSSTSTGLRYQGTQNAGKNAIINGGMDIWQRGTSFAGTTLGAYSADRWGFYRGGAVGGATWTRQTSGLDNIQYSMRIQRDSGNTSTQYMAIWTALENSDSLRFAGKTVTLSYYAKAGANYSGGSITTILNTGTGTNEPPYSFTGSVTAINGTAAVTTSWQRFSFTATLATSARQIAVQLLGYPTGTAGANDWIEITGVQLELGSVATEFLRNGATIQGELSAAQRYYYRATPASNYSNLALGHAISTTGAMLQTKLPTTMRTRPTAIEYGGTIQIFDGVTATNITTLQINQDLVTTTDIANIRANVSSGLTQYRPYQLSTVTDATAYIGFSAEL